jgi:hypothetical protein
LKDSETNRTLKPEMSGAENYSLDDEIVDVLSDCDGSKTCRLLSLLSTQHSLIGKKEIQMKAIKVHEFGGPVVMRLEEVPGPENISAKPFRFGKRQNSLSLKKSAV